MATRKDFTCVLTIVLVFGFFLTGCSDLFEEKELFEGKWGRNYAEGQFEFMDDTFEFTSTTMAWIKGTFTYDTKAHQITFTQTHTWAYNPSDDDAGWIEDTTPPAKFLPPKCLINKGPVNYKFSQYNDKVTGVTIDGQWYLKW